MMEDLDRLVRESFEVEPSDDPPPPRPLDSPRERIVPGLIITGLGLTYALLGGDLLFAALGASVLNLLVSIARRYWLQR